MRSAADTVVLVHGLWMHGIVMEILRRRIERCGYRALTYSYPSVRLTLTENSWRLARYCRGLSASRLHFVGHSLGGLIVLRMLEHSAGLPRGRVVLAGAPFTECYAARRLVPPPRRTPPFGRS